MSNTLQAADIKYELREACPDCPFSKTAPETHFGVIMAIPEYVRLMETGSLLHTCHMTDDRESCDGPRSGKHDTQHCAGLLQLMAVSDAPAGRSFLHAVNQGAEFEEIHTRAMASDRSFHSIKEFVSHYAFSAWAMILIWVENPKVIVLDSLFEEEVRKVPFLKSSGVELVPCCECGQPATRLDPHHPYQAGMELCELCYRDGDIETLLEVLIKYTPKVLERFPRLPEDFSK